MGGFSFASVVLSYFMVAGGMFAGLLVAAYAKVQSEYAAYAIIAVGAAAGGYFAARASRGSTIVEPAIGGLAVVGTIAALLATAGGKEIFMVQDNAVGKAIAMLAASGLIGGLVGAFVGEKYFGDAPTSSVPWVPFSAFATFGACLMATLIGGLIAASTHGDGKTVGVAALIGMGAGCVLSGIAIGASSRARPLLAAFVGGGIGVAGYWMMLAHAAGATSEDKDRNTAIVVLSAGGAFLTFIGAAIGWAAVGRKAPGAVT